MTLIVTAFNASITGDDCELNTSVQFSGEHQVGHGMACSVCAIYSTRLYSHIRQLIELVKFNQRYLSERVALSFNVFADYRRQILYILKSQKGSIEALNFLMINT